MRELVLVSAYGRMVLLERCYRDNCQCYYCSIAGVRVTVTMWKNPFNNRRISYDQYLLSYAYIPFSERFLYEDVTFAMKIICRVDRGEVFKFHKDGFQIGSRYYKKDLSNSIPPREHLHKYIGGYLFRDKDGMMYTASQEKTSSPIFTMMDIIRASYRGYICEGILHVINAVIHEDYTVSIEETKHKNPNNAEIKNHFVRTMFDSCERPCDIMCGTYRFDDSLMFVFVIYRHKLLVIDITTGKQVTISFDHIGPITKIKTEVGSCFTTDLIAGNTLCHIDVIQGIIVRTYSNVLDISTCEYVNIPDDTLSIGVKRAIK